MTIHRELTAEVFLEYLADESYPVGYTWTEETLYREYQRALKLWNDVDSLKDHPYDCKCWRCR
jgi:hypothetical protein